MLNRESCEEGMRIIVSIDTTKYFDHKGFSEQNLIVLKQDVLFLNSISLEAEIERVFAKNITKSIEFLLKLPLETKNRQAALNILYQSNYINHGFNIRGNSLVNEAVLKRDWYNFKYLLKFDQALYSCTMVSFFAKGNEYIFKKISIWNMVHEYNWCAKEFKQSIIDVLEEPITICGTLIKFNISVQCKQHFLKSVVQNEDMLFEIKNAIQAKNYIPFVWNMHKIEVKNFLMALSVLKEGNKIIVPKSIKFFIIKQICGFDDVKLQVENCLNIK